MADNVFLEELGKWTAAIVGSAGALVGGGAMIRKHLVRAQTEVTKDRAEGDFVLTLLKERDDAQADARTAWEARQKDQEVIGRLTSETVYLKREIERMEADFAAFKRQIGRLFPKARPFVESGFSTEIEPEIPQPRPDVK